jgi:hypothetical protein
MTSGGRGNNESQQMTLNENILDPEDEFDEQSPASLPSDAGMLEKTETHWFCELYARLLLFVNERHDVGVDIDDIRGMQTNLQEWKPIRNRLFSGEDTGAIIDAFVADPPEQLTAEDLEEATAWRHYRTGDMLVVDRRSDRSILLDPDPSSSNIYGVQELLGPSSTLAPTHADLPRGLLDVVLLPFNGKIVVDPFCTVDPGVWELIESSMGVDVDERYEELKRNEEVVRSLPMDP